MTENDSRTMSPSRFTAKKKINKNIGGRKIHEYGKPKAPTNFFQWVPVKCETKSKRDETKRNEINRNETKFTETKRGIFRFFSVNFVSIRWISFRFVSFRFRFAFYRYTHKDVVFQWCLLDSKSNWHNFHIFSSFYFIFSQSKNRITNQLHVFDPTKLQRELPFNLKKGEGGACHFFYKIFRFWSLEKKSN
jgi:hypothetical protein